MVRLRSDLDGSGRPFSPTNLEMDMKLYDIHVATDVISDRAARNNLHQLLIAAGYHDDELKENGLSFDKRTAEHFATCPLIDIHMSRKIGSRKELQVAEKLLDHLMSTAVPPGYWHSECVPDGYDRHINPIRGTWEALPWFCEPLQLNVSAPRHKVWDLHISLREDSVPIPMKRHLIEHGIYFLSRWKQRDGVRSAWSVFTVQGTTPVHHGLEFFDNLIQWLQHSGAPAFDAKLEITTAMQVYRNPKRVPPTVEEIVYL